MSPKSRRVGILGHPGRAEVRRAAARLFARLRRLGHQVRLDQALANGKAEDTEPLGTLASWCELLVVLGGDGTTLRGARALAGKRGVLLPVNHGGLGFLTAAEEPELDAAVDAALKGRWPVERRRLVSASVRHRGRVRRAVALNDAVIKTAGGASAVHLRLSALGADLGHLVADGLIVATAAGSTAYSLSAGGPILAPGLDAVVVTPVCPHTLGSRPLVLSASAVLDVRVLGAFERVMLLLDGQERIDLDAGDELSMGLGRTAVRVFNNPDRPFSRALQAKLGWQGSELRSMT